MLGEQQAAQADLEMDQVQKEYGIYIETLPAGYRSISQVKTMVEDVMKLGSCSSVHILKTTASEGIERYSGHVFFSSCRIRGVGALHVPISPYNLDMLPRGVSSMVNLNTRKMEYIYRPDFVYTFSWDNGEPMKEIVMCRLDDANRCEFCGLDKKLE
jgi:hypothetical protein